MDNDEMLLIIKDMFEKSMEKMEQKFDKKVEEVKNHTGVLVENLEKKISAVAEGYDILNSKYDILNNKYDILNNKIDNLDKKIDDAKSELSLRIDNLDKTVNLVKDYVIGVDEKLNEHEIILKRVK